MTIDFISCDFCKGNHNTRDCHVELKLAPEIKKFIGNLMEYYFCNYFSCPKCKNKSLTVLGNNKPSLDIICSICSKNIEIKSKCLSIDKLPNDIICHGGNYNNFINNITNINLDLAVIIYGVDYISYINTLLYNTTSSVPSLNATTPPLQNFKKTKGKSIRKRKQ
jgi:hypothetical protein